MKKSLIIGSAVAAAVSMASAPQISHAAGANEKCYGVVKAGQNDCATNNSSCKGTSTADGQKDAWVFVPTGMCEKLVGGSTEKG